MSTEVTLHPTAKIALVAVVIAVAAGSGLVGLKRILKPEEGNLPLKESTSASPGKVEILPDFLLPVIGLPIDPEAPESNWSEALAAVLSGRTEVTTEHGRVDVLTDRFAIEVDRLTKWHESIGQASHYASTTGKRPVVALIILPNDNTDKLELVEDTCTSKGIKLIILQTTKAQSGRNSD